MMISFRTSLGMFLGLGLFLLQATLPAAGQTILNIEDTFSRADIPPEGLTDLGTTEVGGYEYDEAGTVGDGDVAGIFTTPFSDELVVHGAGGVLSTDPGVAMIDANFTDVSIAADMRFEGLGLFGLGSGTNNTSGFMLRRNGTTAGFDTGNEGQVEVSFLPSGGLFIREIFEGALNTLYTENPFGLGGSADNTYGGAGTLPSSFNGMPFDVNGNGVLEDGEQFRLGASLEEDMLTVSVNGLAVANVTTSYSEPQRVKSQVGLYKNRYTSAAGLDQFNGAFDNLVISGTEYIPPPPAPILHIGDADPATEDWIASTTGTVVNNGPVDDGGVAAWNIEDDGSGRAAWTRTLRDEQIEEALSEGWTYKATLKLLDLDDPIDGSVELSVFPDSDVGYTLWFGSDANGDALLGEFGGTLSEGLALGRTAVVPGQDYVDYEITFDPATETVDVFADGELVIDDMIALNREGSSLNRILWGSNQGSSSGNANYARVEFVIGADEGLPGDYNGDSVVDGQDMILWQRNDGTAGGLAGWQANYGAGVGGAATQLPEPAAAWLLVLACAVGAFQRRRSLQ